MYTCSTYKIVAKEKCIQDACIFTNAYNVYAIKKRNVYKMQTFLKVLAKYR